MYICSLFAIQYVNIILTLIQSTADVKRYNTADDDNFSQVLHVLLYFSIVRSFVM